MLNNNQIKSLTPKEKNYVVADSRGLFLRLRLRAISAGVFAIRIRESKIECHWAYIQKSA